MPQVMLVIPNLRLGRGRQIYMSVNITIILGYTHVLVEALLD